MCLERGELNYEPLRPHPLAAVSLVSSQGRGVWRGTSRLSALGGVSASWWRTSERESSAFFWSAARPSVNDGADTAAAYATRQLHDAYDRV